MHVNVDHTVRLIAQHRVEPSKFVIRFLRSHNQPDFDYFSAALS